MKPFLPSLLVCLATSTVVAAPPTEVLNKYACAGCHGMTQKVVVPGFNEVAAKYQGQKDARSALSASIRAGGSGKWGQVPMPPQAALTDAELASVVDWLLGGAKP
jgi:cytochrome c551/c552